MAIRRRGVGEREKMEGLALVGRNVPITSEVFCVSCGPPGGGGGTTRGPAIVDLFYKQRACR